MSAFSLHSIDRDVLLSDQVDRRELKRIVQECQQVIEKGVTGDVVEFGCYVGTSSVYLAKLIEGSDRQLYLYDSFEGLPEKVAKDQSPVGLQFRSGELLATKRQLITNLKRANVTMPVIKKGWFSDLTPSDVPANIGFAFLDGDYYHSVMDPLKLIWPNLTPGAVIVVDDYANEALPGAAHAVNEWLRTHSGKLTVYASLAIIQT
ncbi:MAG: hypothetical protein EOO17_01940 [Chloroflexi bacterium]|nr:MAG: hypothetical protein EOO17_01940 [Chloroflexota bacterium]